MNKERRFYIRIIKKKRDSIRIKKKEKVNYYRNVTGHCQYIVHSNNIFQHDHAFLSLTKLTNYQHNRHVSIKYLM